MVVDFYISSFKRAVDSRSMLFPTASGVCVYD